MDFQCKISFTKISKSTEIRQHGFDAHIPKEHVDYKYPFSQADLRIIALTDKDHYNNEVRPRTLPLRDGICILEGTTPERPRRSRGAELVQPLILPPS